MTPLEPATPDTRLPPGVWRGWLYGLGLMGFAVVATAALIDALRQTIKLIVMNEGWIGEFLYAFGVDMFIGCAILLAVTWAVNRAPSRGPRQYATVFVAVAAAAAAAVFVYMIVEDLVYIEPGEPHMTIDELALLYVPEWLRFAMLGFLIAGAWLYMRAESEHATALEQVALDSARMDEQTAEARLQMLEAQIEPHFLFNTLAHVKWLYGTDRVTGARMLHNLKEYLAVALPQMRERESTLEREVAHVKAYLNIQQIRMGRRLAFSIDVPDALLDASIPPLILAYAGGECNQTWTRTVGGGRAHRSALIHPRREHARDHCRHRLRVHQVHRRRNGTCQHSRAPSHAVWWRR